MLNWRCARTCFMVAGGTEENDMEINMNNCIIFFCGWSTWGHTAQSMVIDADNSILFFLCMFVCCGMWRRNEFVSWLLAIVWFALIYGVWMQLGLNSNFLVFRWLFFLVTDIIINSNGWWELICLGVVSSIYVRFMTNFISLIIYPFVFALSRTLKERFAAT